MPKKEKKSVVPVVKPLKRKRDKRIVVMLNDMEYDAFERYVKNSRIRNKSKLVRDILLQTILKRMSEDYPSLFD